MPGLDDSHIALVSTLKHWDAYSLEDSDGAKRYNFNAVVSPYALATTYYPAFEKSVVEGGALGVMCSCAWQQVGVFLVLGRLFLFPFSPPTDNALNGVPTCASPSLTHVLRDVWGFRGYVTSDSGALENIANDHHYTNSSLASVPVALRDGQTDVCSGSIYANNLLSALAAGAFPATAAYEGLCPALAVRTLALAHAPRRSPTRSRYARGHRPCPFAHFPYALSDGAI